ncbi:hypothetical protein E4U40_002956 [Claviceps sp. LM458 group G5]|nr:hypothetical protein E4U40_002956 [Claviceps sp. LM458 group G5]
MKFSSVLSTFALATLEAYHAYASPLEAMSPGARSLEGRADEKCCLQVHSGIQYDKAYSPVDWILRLRMEPLRSTLRVGERS